MTSRTIESLGERPRAAGPTTLLRAEAVRNGAERLLALALGGALDEWFVDLDCLPPTADLVTQVVRERYPRLEVPVHSRWRHFIFGERDLWQALATRAVWRDPAAQARAALDLVITSVLLDAGAGAGWQYQDHATGLVASRSEGLALASIRWFEAGGLSDDCADPLRVDAAALRRLEPATLGTAMQANEGNALLGLEGRAALLNRLGAALESRPDLFALAGAPRPGGLFDALCARASGGRLSATSVLETLLDALGPIWQDRPMLEGVPLGDCWPHPALKGNRPEDGYLPLHKLSQWLTYSLIEPLEQAGLVVADVEALTGLAEYRNGGLFVDLGVLKPREPLALSRTYAVADPLVVGWRSLTVALLDRLAPLVRERLGCTAREFPLARLLEGGTWAAGRLMARRLRLDGGPPFHVLSDGTVF